MSVPFRKYSNFEKCKIARDKKSDVTLHILSFYGAPSLFCPASPWPLHSQNPGAAAAVQQGVARKFSRGGPSWAPGEGSPLTPAIFQFPGGGLPRFLVASMVKMKEFPPLPMPAYALYDTARNVYVST